MTRVMPKMTKSRSSGPSQVSVYQGVEAKVTPGKPNKVNISIRAGGKNVYTN